MRQFEPLLLVPALQRRTRQGMAASAHDSHFRTEVEVLRIRPSLERKAARGGFRRREALRVRKVSHDGIAHLVAECETVNLAHARQGHDPAFGRLANRADAVESAAVLLMAAAAIGAQQIIRRQGFGMRRARSQSAEHQRGRCDQKPSTPDWHSYPPA